MTNHLRQLYQQVVVDHSRHPRNFRKIDAPDFVAEGHNPLCGDEISVTIKWDGDAICDLAFQGKGCAICMASASMMTQSVRGRERSDVMTLLNAFHDMLTQPQESADTQHILGKLTVFAGVRQFPSRVKCATLPWHTLKACVDKHDGVVRTE